MSTTGTTTSTPYAAARARSAGAPEVPTGRLELQPPPRVEDHEGAGGVLVTAVPMLGSIGSIALVATMGGADRARGLLAAGMFLLATVGFVVIQVDRHRGQRRRKVAGARAAYLRHLAEVRATVRDAADRQRRALTWRHPHPSALPALAEDRSRLWRREPGGPGLQVRYGVCAGPLSLELVAPGQSEPAGSDRVDPVGAAALQRLLEVQRTQSDLPATLDLREAPRVEVCGEDEPARSLARALVCSAAAAHGPDRLVVAAHCSPDALPHWDWLKWLPHARSARRTDAAGPRRMVATDLDELLGLVPPDLADRPEPTLGAGAGARPPHLLLVVDGGHLPPGHRVLPPGGLPGVTVLALPTRSREPDDSSALRLELTGPTAPEAGRAPPLRVLRPGDEPVEALADQCGPATAEAFARRLAALPTTGDGLATGPSGPGADVVGLLGLGDVTTFDPRTAWRERPARDLLRVPIGTGEDGVVHLDLKESAQHGMGPHGLLVGATGSGKSELLRTLVLGLAATHSPAQLNLVLVDFKGGATFAGTGRLPHVSAVITNLAQEVTLVDRMHDALSGEMVRRQELLRASGHASLREHEEARAAGADLAPLPSLLVVVDEFSEMLSARPELVELFVAIGRLGRSLGLHLLLATQRLEEGRLRGLESHLSYRIGLRTFSAGESRAVLGVPDAHELPPVPGVGYLRSGPSSLRRFQAAYVSGPPPDRAPAGPDEPAPRIVPFTVAEVPLPEPTPAPRRPPGDRDPVPDRPPADRRSLLDLAVARMAGHGPAAHRVWLPPLDVPDTLDALMPDLVEDPELGLVSPRWRARGGLVVPVGTVDRPREQRRDPLVVDLGGAAGHVAVVGAPRSGKSTLLRTVVTATALVTTPVETQLFVLDLGGGAAAGLSRLPHLAGVATRAEPDVVRRVVAQVRGVLDRREELFRAHGIDSMATYRARRARGEVDDGYGDVFLVVDGWGTLRSELDDLEAELQQLATRGLAHGLHLVAASTRWADFRPSVRDVLGTRLELRLGDPVDSEVDRRAAASVPTDRPGRGLVPGPAPGPAPGGLHVLGALPRVDGDPRAETLGAGVERLAARAAAAWRGPAGPKLRLLPERVGLERVRDRARAAGVAERLLVLGVDEEHAPVGLDVDAEPHLLVLGEGRSGRTALLRAYLHEVVRTRTPEEAQVVVVDPRRSLLGEVPEEYLLEHLSGAARAGPVLQELADHLTHRVPGPDVTTAQLRDRSWWSGAELFVVVVVHDLVTATPLGAAVAVLQPLMAQAGDVGLHVVVARRSGGAARALHEPVLQSLRDLAAPGVLLSTSPEDGYLLGGLRPGPAAPGRARLVTRDRGVETVQVAWADPAA